MAIINNATLNNLRTTIRGEFNIAFKNANATSLYKRLATTVKSTSKTNTYDWLGKFPQMREWVGKRVLKDMSEATYQITNSTRQHLVLNVLTLKTITSVCIRQLPRVWDKRQMTFLTEK